MKNIALLVALALNTFSLVCMEGKNIFDQYKKDVLSLEKAVLHCRTHFSVLIAAMKNNKADCASYTQALDIMNRHADGIYEQYWDRALPESTRYLCHPTTCRFQSFLSESIHQQGEVEETNEILLREKRDFDNLLNLTQFIAAIDTSLSRALESPNEHQDDSEQWAKPLRRHAAKETK